MSARENYSVGYNYLKIFSQVVSIRTKWGKLTAKDAALELLSLKGTVLEQVPVTAGHVRTVRNVFWGWAGCILGDPQSLTKVLTHNQFRPYFVVIWTNFILLPHFSNPPSPYRCCSLFLKALCYNFTTLDGGREVFVQTVMKFENK